MKKGIQRLVAAAVLLPSAAMAQSLNYNYVEGGLALYPSWESQTFFGVDFRGSAAITDNVFAFGGLKYLTDDVDLTALHVGGAYRHGLDARTDLWGGVTLEYQDWNAGRGQSADDTAIGFRGGLRHQLNTDLEIGGGLRVVTGDFDYVGLTGTARYSLDRNLQVFAEVDIYDSEVGLIGGLTMKF